MWFKVLCNHISLIAIIGNPLLYQSLEIDTYISTYYHKLFKYQAYHPNIHLQLGQTTESEICLTPTKVFWDLDNNLSDINFNQYQQLLQQLINAPNQANGPKNLLYL